MTNGKCQEEEEQEEEEEEQLLPLYNLGFAAGKNGFRSSPHCVIIALSKWITLLA